MQNRQELIQRIEVMVLPVLEGLGYDLLETRIVVAHGRKTLRFFIDKPGGVTVEDCARASRLIGDVLDAEDVFEGRYYLEVSSPGAERALRTAKDFVHFRGRRALVRLVCKKGGRAEVEGEIVDCVDNIVYLKLGDGEIFTASLDSIASARLCL